MIILTMIVMLITMLLSPIGWLVNTFGVQPAIAWGISSGGALVVAWVLKKIPNDKIKIAVGAVMFTLGTIITGFFGGKWKYTKPFWNKLIEPWVIDLLDNVAAHGITELIKGLRSDN